MINGPDNQAQDLKYQINQYLSEILIVTLDDELAVADDAGEVTVFRKLEVDVALFPLGARLPGVDEPPPWDVRTRASFILCEPWKGDAPACNHERGRRERRRARGQLVPSDGGPQTWQIA